MKVPPLISGGIMLSYRCSSECKHCLYRCSPKQPDEWLTLDMARRIFDSLAAEPGLQGIHFAGGEATMKFDLLLQLIRMALDSGITIDYLETNAFWCRDRGKTFDGMKQLRDAGLEAILVSVSMFHNEYIPFYATRNCIEAAHEVLGTYNTIVYMPHMYDILSSMPDDGTHSIEEICAHIGIDPKSSEVPALYGLIPGGRAVEAFRDCYQLRQAKSFKGDACGNRLPGTSHFHIDHYGNLFTGSCGGINPSNIEDLHPEITPETHPVYHTLCTEGPYGLMLMAAERHGFTPDRSGYAGKCDLCFQVRKAMRASGSYPELHPESFYTV